MLNDDKKEERLLDEAFWNHQQVLKEEKKDKQTLMLEELDKAAYDYAGWGTEFNYHSFFKTYFKKYFDKHYCD